jgi:hypothetical protein
MHKTTRVQVGKVKVQLEQTSAHSLTSISNQMNWDLFDRHEHMPPALPSWIGLSDSEWAWRVLHLNHLNLLQLARHDYMHKLMSKSEFDGWQSKASYWFQNLRVENPSSEIQSGRKTLQQVLRSEEGYPKEFRQWLVESQIIPSDLVSD